MQKIIGTMNDTVEEELATLIALFKKKFCLDKVLFLDMKEGKGVVEYSDLKSEVDEKMIVQILSFVAIPNYVDDKLYAVMIAYVEMMDVSSAAKSLLTIVNDILDMSKIESGKMEIIPTEYDLFSMINAVKYTPKGQICFEMQGQITGEEVELLVRVSDTGLGMAITASLLQMMGSQLDVKSEYGKGTTFSFRLKQKIIRKEPIGLLKDHCGTYGKMYEYKPGPRKNTGSRELIIICQNLLFRRIWKR